MTPRPSPPGGRVWAPPTATTTYRLRSGIAERTNAQFHTRRHLYRFTVCGLSRVTSVVLLLAVTHNLLRYLALSAQAVAQAA